MFTTHQSIIICLFISAPAVPQFEDDRCRVESTGGEGKCVPPDDCDYAKELLRSRQIPQYCGFDWVCCPFNTTSRIPGEISEKICERYYPKPTGPNGGGYGGVPAVPKEFPHMAILGYGDRNDIHWSCGASLISADFVLTAAHCIREQELGEVRWVRLGDLDYKSTTDDTKPQDFKVGRIYIHPEYRPISKYHDIALIKLDKLVNFDAYVKLACLYSNWTLNRIRRLIATGWGKRDYYGELSNYVLKVELTYINHEECAERYSDDDSKAKLKQGIVDEWQICAGDSNGTDTCPGDSGGSLQFKDYSRGPPHLYVVGITSFGKTCGDAHSKSMGVYTRVAPYIQWIEDIVWPLE